ncbi:MAG TPA: hypothetical protein DCE55_16000 [Planctomycetaceae bacterium]|nr:hypothetical protein [Planctomycetaceae bacterium]|tara:strand:+ start:783 stop:1085 length:303 start_codon:yes stop_codon:yes gene_type:complete
MVSRWPVISGDCVAVRKISPQNSDVNWPGSVDVLVFLTMYSLAFVCGAGWKLRSTITKRFRDVLAIPNWRIAGPGAKSFQSSAELRGDAHVYELARDRTV